MMQVYNKDSAILYLFRLAIEMVQVYNKDSAIFYLFRLAIEMTQVYNKESAILYLFRLAIEMMQVYNKDSAIVFNTYQNYLRKSYKTIVLDLEQVAHGELLNILYYEVLHVFFTWGTIFVRTRMGFT